MKKINTSDSAGGLVITASPIGNLGDLGARAREAMEKADIIACEDTRHTGRMLKRLGINAAKLVSYHDHSRPAAGQKLLAAMQAGRTVVLVSDAGTPLVCDPGWRLVRACHENAIAVTAIPGPSAMLAGLVLSGIEAGDGFFFAGFLPPRATARRKRLDKLLGMNCPVIAYESGARITAALTDIAGAAPLRAVAVVREATKLHEEVMRGNAAEVLAVIGSRKTVKGEITLVIGGGDDEKPAIDDGEIQNLLAAALGTGMTRRDAVAHVSARTGIPRKKVYAIAIAIAIK